MTQSLKQSFLNPQQKSAIETIQANHQAAITRLNEILDLSRIEAGAFALKSQPFNLLTCIEDCLQQQVLNAIAKGLSLLSVIPPNVPEMVMGDCDRLQQVLNILLEHSLLFTENGEICIRVAIQPISDEIDVLSASVICFNIQSTGLRIPNGLVSQRLEPFNHVNPESLICTDTGVSLALSQRLTQHMGGSLWVETNPEQPSSLHVSIQLPHASQENTDTFQTAALAGKRLLIVDSSPTVLESLSLQVQRWGVVVRTVPSVTQALNQLHYERFDGVLLECCPPSSEEQSLINLIRQQTNDIRLPLIALLPMDIKGNAAVSNTDMSLSKPVRRVELYRVLQRLSDE